MAPESFENFFLSTAAAGAAFIGLLFVAISIGPMRTFGDSDASAAHHQHLAEVTLVMLVNGFLVSSIALIPDVNFGWAALVLGGIGMLVGANFARHLVRVHRHGFSRRGSSLHFLRVVGPTLVGVMLYAAEGLCGLGLLLQPAAPSAFRRLALIMIGLYALGIVRAWTLLGDPRHGWSGWLNPLQDIESPGERDEALSKTNDDALGAVPRVAGQAWSPTRHPRPGPPRRRHSTAHAIERRTE